MANEDKTVDLKIYVNLGETLNAITDYFSSFVAAGSNFDEDEDNSRNSENIDPEITIHKMILEINKALKITDQLKRKAMFSENLNYKKNTRLINSIIEETCCKGEKMLENVEKEGYEILKLIEDIGIKYKNDDIHVLEDIFKGNQLEPHNFINQDFEINNNKNKDDVIINDSSEDSIITDECLE